MTLREVVVDQPGYEDALTTATDEDRIWLLRIGGRLDEAEQTGRSVLEARGRHFRPLLLLSHVLHWQGKFSEAAELQAEALVLASTDQARATAMQHIGKRLFDEARVRKALAAFETSLSLRKSSGADVALIESSAMAVDRCRTILGGRYQP